MNEPEGKEAPEQKGPGCLKIFLTTALIAFGVLLVLVGGCFFLITYPNGFH